jgi:2,4-dienoyl-CoA reductase (NADPH2)
MRKMSNPHRFEHLLQPGRIGTVQTKNRIMKNGTHNFYDTEDGLQNDRNIDFYDVLARGGVGLIVVASAPLVPDARGYRIDRDDFIPGFARLADTIHRHEVPALVQLFHVGPMSPPFFEGPQPVAASSIPKNESPRPQWGVARSLTIPEIEEIEERFIQAAVRIKKAGYQGIELNSATNHLLNTFLSRAWNRREDEFGVENLDSRTKIVTDIIKEVKRLNGDDFAVIALINGAEVGLKNGITTEESTAIARILQDAGADAIEVRAEYYSWTADDALRESTHFPDVYFYPEPSGATDAPIDRAHFGAGANVPLAAAVKKHVSVPVITVGRLDPVQGEAAIREGSVDFVSFNRRLIADPELPNKVMAGHLGDIAPCTACISCFNLGEHGQPVECRVNAALGREREYEIKPAGHKKKVMVVGGGPAGMEAARVAALRGHDVSLYEKERYLGGSLPLAAMVKGFEREDLMALSKYLERQIVKLGVKIHRGTAVGRREVAKEKPDVLIVAAGGAHREPEVAGLDRSNVVTGENLHKRLKSYLAVFGPKLLRQLTHFHMPLGRRVVIMGGGIHGCQVAEYLVRMGRKVTIVESGEQIGEGLPDILIRPYLLNWLREKGVAFMAGVSYERITERGLVVKTSEGIMRTVEADTIVTALPLLANSNLARGLQGSAPEVHIIGDSRAPGMIIDAVADGSRIGRVV